MDNVDKCHSILKLVNDCEASQFVDINIRGASSIVYNLVYMVRDWQGDRGIVTARYALQRPNRLSRFSFSFFILSD